MEQQIEKEMASIEAYGGIVKAVADGYAQRLVARQAYEVEKGLASGELLKVGLNIYAEGESMDVDLHEYNEESAEKQIASLRAVKRERSEKDVARTLKDLEEVTRAGKNVMPCLVACCKAYATVGEMASIFRDIFGEFQEPSLF
jgi:methylmalonyl-CoA mutase N-terminal domain/subunit